MAISKSQAARMNTEEARLEKNRESVRRWYANHREEYSKLRRQRYRADPKLRKRAREASAQYRRARQQGGIKVTRSLTRVFNGVPVTVYTSGYVSDRVKYSPQVLRSWEARGWIPQPLFVGEKHRLYTARQVALMKLLADTVRSKPGRRRPDPVALGEVLKVIHKTWKVVDHGVEDGQKARRGRR
jgi:hypothetical protein